MEVSIKDVSFDLYNTNSNSKSEARNEEYKLK
jgi:hypothetical protein